MSCTCSSPVRPEFKDSYKDLLDKPSINGTVIDGNIETDNLGIKYPTLDNLPQINGVTLSGNLTAADLGIKAGAQFKIVTALPVTDIDEATVYLVPAQVGQNDNIYQEWIYINNKWEKIGEPINIQTENPTVKCENLYLDISEDMSLFSYSSIKEFFLNPKPELNTAYISFANEFGGTGLHIRNYSPVEILINYNNPSAEPSSFTIKGGSFKYFQGIVLFTESVYFDGSFV